MIELQEARLNTQIRNCPNILMQLKQPTALAVADALFLHLRLLLTAVVIPRMRHRQLGVFAKSKVPCPWQQSPANEST